MLPTAAENFEVATCHKGPTCLESGVRNAVSKSSTLLIYSFVRERDSNTENVPSRVNGILSPVSSSKRE